VILGFLSEFCAIFSRNDLFCSKYRAAEELFRVVATVHVLEHNRSDIPADLTFPVALKAEVPACYRPEEFLLRLDPAAILKNAANTDQAVFAFRLALFASRMTRKAPCSWTDDPPCVYHPDFWPSVSSLLDGSDQLPRVLLESMIEVIERSNLRKTHALRTSRAGNAPAREAFGFKAMRHDVTSDHHLHYWELGTPGVEFSRLAFPHDDFSIAQPVARPQGRR